MTHGRLRFLKDHDGGELLLDDSDQQVMMEWEKNYMLALVDGLQPKGKVLEIGFGLGYSADRIQNYDIEKHTIIEIDPLVAFKARSWASTQNHPVEVIEGSWQQSLTLLDKFDSVFFDDFPTKEYPDTDNNRVYELFYRLLKAHANVGCRFTWYCDAPIYWLSHPDTTWSLGVMSIEVPQKVQYVPFVNGCREQLYLPLVTFPRGVRKDAEPLVFDKFLQFKHGGWV